SLHRPSSRSRQPPPRSADSFSLVSHCSRHQRSLHSFPTRRSSDLLRFKALPLTGYQATVRIIVMLMTAWKILIQQDVVFGSVILAGCYAIILVVALIIKTFLI